MINIYNKRLALTACLKDKKSTCLVSNKLRSTLNTLAVSDNPLIHP